MPDTRAWHRRCGRPVHCQGCIHELPASCLVVRRVGCLAVVRIAGIGETPVRCRPCGRAYGRAGRVAAQRGSDGAGVHRDLERKLRRRHQGARQQARHATRCYRQHAGGRADQDAPARRTEPPRPREGASLRRLFRLQHARRRPSPSCARDRYARRRSTNRSLASYTHRQPGHREPLAAAGARGRIHDTINHLSTLSATATTPAATAATSADLDPRPTGWRWPTAAVTSPPNCSPPAATAPRSPR